MCHVGWLRPKIFISAPKMAWALSAYAGSMGTLGGRGKHLYYSLMWEKDAATEGAGRGQSGQLIQRLLERPLCDLMSSVRTDCGKSISLFVPQRRQLKTTDHYDNNRPFFCFCFFFFMTAEMYVYIWPSEIAHWKEIYYKLFRIIWNCPMFCN